MPGLEVFRTRAHPESLDIEPGSCEWYIQSDRHFGTKDDSPLSHKSRHTQGSCKPMARFEQEDIKSIISYEGEEWPDEGYVWHTQVNFEQQNDNAYGEFICSCGEALINDELVRLWY